ncbi:WD repeat-containing protein 61 [Lactarius deliciosus]|nr:WD repeat-containing protein 61 [Lactarius deliciosus]
MSLAYVHALDCAEPHGDAVWDISWTAKDNAVVSISADGIVKRWNSASGQVMRTAPAHTLGLVSLSVSPDGKYALYNSVDGTTFLWDLEAGTIIGKHESFTRPGAEPSWSVSLNPRGKAETFGEQRTTLQSGRGKFGMRCSHSPDGSRLALSVESGQIFIFDLASGTLTSTYTSHAMAVRSLSWSPDSQLLLSASEDKRLILYDVRTTSSGRPSSGAVASLTGHSSWVLSSDISPDGRLALSGSADKTIKVWDLAARAAVSTVADTGEVWAVSWQPSSTATSSSAFVTGGEDGTVRWWKAAGTS